MQGLEWFGNLHFFFFMSGGYHRKCYPDTETTLANACDKPTIVYKFGIKRNTKEADHSIYIYI